MHERICRRDFLNATLLASGSALMHGRTPRELVAAGDDWTGYGGVGDYRNSNGNTWEVMNAGHQIRDHVYNTLPASVTDTGEIFDCVVVGGGISGLAAALFFIRGMGNGAKCLVLDNHPIFGGEAKRNEFLVSGKRLIAHQGSAFFPVPYPYSFIARFYESVGLKQFFLPYQTWSGGAAEMRLPTTPYDSIPENYGFYFGAKFGQKPGVWVIDPWRKQLEGCPISTQARQELLSWSSGHSENNPRFPRPTYEGDTVSRHLDTLTLEDYLMARYGVSRETLRAFLGDEGSGYGMGADVLSAYCEYAADLLHPLRTKDSSQMFPGGNAGFARLIVKTLIPDSITGPATVEGMSAGRVNFGVLDRPGQPVRVRLGSTAVWAKHEDGPERSQFVTIAYTQGGRVYRLKARSAVMAGGCWTTKHIVRDLPSAQRDAYDQFFRSPCLMMNVAVRNWRFLHKMGISGCGWFEGLGSYLQVRKLARLGGVPPTIGPDSPVVLTVKILFGRPGLPLKQQGDLGRMKLLTTSFRDYERTIRVQLAEMFSRSGFDPKRTIAGIILNRWGHAYVNPQPGFFFGNNGQPAARDVLRGTPFGRIAFANTDLAGVADHRCSILEAQRAVSQLLDQVLSS